MSAAAGEGQGQRMQQTTEPLFYMSRVSRKLGEVQLST